MTLIDRLSRVESRNITCPKSLIWWKRAAGSEVWDESGKRYIDFSSAFGVASIGHSHPKLIDAIADQSRKLIHGMGDVHPSVIKIELMEKLAKLFGEPAKTILSLTGSDAVESALKTAMIATGRPRVLAFEGAYHGLGYGAMAVTSGKAFRDPFRGQMGDFVTHIPYGSDPRSQLASREYGAVIVEPIQGRAGIVVPPPGALKMIVDTAREFGAVSIFDEIMTGFGRTGSLFAFEQASARPDILCVGKALGGGIPISATVGRAEIMDAWPPSTGEAIHTSTFLGHPLACRAALTSIGVIEKEKLVEKARSDGDYVVGRLAKWKPRGRGLMIGIPHSRASAISRAALETGLIVLGEGTAVALLPPLSIPRAILDEGLDILEDALERNT